MGKHQIIYTSCKRGIDRINDGQQVYSYDALFHDSHSPEICGLFSYTPPVSSAEMTDDLAKTMPQAFMYRRLRNGSGAVVLNTYIGRDYAGPHTRFGNHLSHVIICDETSLGFYPCELYKSELLKNNMTPDEVNNPNKPAFLPTPTIIPGNIINIESVVTFLSVSGRIDIYKKMLSTLLSCFCSSKRLLILDQEENIIFWIAALQYAFPLRLALSMSFTTYDFNPSRSIYNVCGIVPLQNTDKECFVDHHFFDLLNNSIPITAVNPLTEKFCSFIEKGLISSDQFLRDYHSFVSTMLTHISIDQAYFNSFLLFQLYTNGYSAISQSEFVNATQYIKCNNMDLEIPQFIEKLLEERNAIAILRDHAYSIEIIRFIVKNAKLLLEEQKSKVQYLLIKRSTTALSDSEIEDLFCLVIDELSKRTDMLNIRVNFACEYMLRKDVTPVQLQKGEIGRLIAKVLFPEGTPDTEMKNICRDIITKYSDDIDTLLRATHNIDILLCGLDKISLSMFLWESALTTLATRYTQSQSIEKSLLSIGKVDQAYRFYCVLLEQTQNLHDANSIYASINKLSNTTYIEKHYSDFMCSFYQRITTRWNKDAALSKVALLQAVIERKLRPQYVNALVNDVLGTLDDAKMINKLLNYYHDVNQTDIPISLLVVTVGLVIHGARDIDSMMTGIMQLCKVKTMPAICLAKVKTADSFLESISPCMYKICKTSNDFYKCYRIFDLSPLQAAKLCIYWAHESVNDKIDMLAEYLAFLFDVGKIEINRGVGNVLHKLSQSTLEELHQIFKVKFKKNKPSLRQWNEMMKLLDSRK
jgi:hypothetical protein